MVSSCGLEADKAKVEVIQKLPLPTNTKELRGFLGHVGFYRRFIKDFAKLSIPLLAKDMNFINDDAGKQAFLQINEALVKALILQTPNWNYPFELMCDASDFAVGVVLGQQLTRSPWPSTMLAKP
ncbi:putative mitochondrial protein AtMg00860 [Wolffia australiana]